MTPYNMMLALSILFENAREHLARLSLDPSRFREHLACLSFDTTCIFLALSASLRTYLRRQLLATLHAHPSEASQMVRAAT